MNARRVEPSWGGVVFRALLTWGAPLPRRPQALLCDPVGVDCIGVTPLGSITMVRARRGQSQW